MTGITERLPAPLSERLSSASAAIYSRQGREVDVAVGGIPFRLATNSELPQSVETIQIRKDQFDSEQDPGEQSLTGWWRRSQSSWHEGAGSLYQESSESTIASNTFYTSSGVDVFTPGRMTLLKKMKVATQTAGSQLGRIRTFAANSVRTNSCQNPSFETNATGWTVLSDPGTATTIARDGTRAWIGSWSGLATWGTDNGAGFPPAIIPPFTAGPASTKYTCSVRVWVPTGSVGVSLVGNGVFGTSSGALKDQWVELHLTATTDGSGNCNPAIWPTTTATAGMTFWVDACIIEHSTSVVGAYFDGSSPNSAWTGTANNSTSTETIVAGSASVSAVGSGSLFTSTLPEGTYTALHSPGGKTIIDGLISSTTFYDVATDGTLYQGSTGAPGSATSWPCGTTPARLAWGKHRLWMIGGRKLWQPDVTLAGGTTQNPIFTHPNLGWTYTCIAEGTAAMYFGGHDGFASTIQAVTLDSGGGLPTLSGATTTAALPDGELVQELAVLAGQYVGIGTNRGFRVGISNSSGQITYGPLIIQPEGVVACSSICTQGQFFLVGFRTTGGNALAYRVDTGTPLDGGAFPYAPDIDTGSVGALTSLAAFSATQIVATSGDGQVWYQSPTEYVSSGYLQTGRVRYRTTEPKVFKYLTVEIDPLAGAIALELIKEGGSSLSVGSITKQGEVFDGKFGTESEAMRYASLKFTLTPTANLLAAPVIHSYLLRALPAVAPQRLITLPLLCWDKEKARSGQAYGGFGFAKDRLTALQLFEAAGDSLIYQDYSSGSSTGQVVVIESIKYVATSPPTADNSGGILLLQLRTVDS